MSIAWGPKGNTGGYLVVVDGVAKGFAGANAARDAKRHAERVSVARGGKVITPTVYPADPTPEPVPEVEGADEVPEVEPTAWEGNVISLKVALASGALDERLDALEAGEKSKAKPRPTALKAIAARRAAILPN